MADKLQKLRPKFVKCCNKATLQLLLDDLRHEGVLSETEVEYIEESHPERANKCRTLIDTVIKKGDHSCNVLIHQLLKNDEALSKDLGLTEELPLPIQEQNTKGEQPAQSGNASVKPPAPAETPPAEIGQSSQQEINGVILCSEAEYREITSKERNIYPIREKGKRKRLALIICNIKFDESVQERKGANVDIEEMRSLLEGLGYDVQYKINQTAAEMQTTMKNFAARSEHKDSDSTFLVFMSHGERDIIYGTDMKREYVDGQERVTGNLQVDSIFSTFNNVSCPGLRDKPKIIIIQACRGSDLSQVLVTDGAQQPPNIGLEDLEEDAMRVTQREEDFICFYSTTPDTVSFRHKSKGSLFIQRLVKVMKEDAHKSSIEDIFQKVQLSFKDDVQMPTQERKTLLKKFFLFPGF